MGFRNFLKNDKRWCIIPNTYIPNQDTIANINGIEYDVEIGSKARNPEVLPTIIKVNKVNM